jgi:hypothetical protein
MLLMEKISNGDREPAVVPPHELPPLVRLREKGGAQGG